MIDYLVVIPARYKSTRFPGKALADIHGKSMIQRVWEKCFEATNTERMLIATDDDRILEYCKDHKMQVLLTSNNCLTGTDHLYEMAQEIKAEVYRYVQGDKPLISLMDIKAVIQVSQKEPDITCNAMCSIKNDDYFRNPNAPKVVTRKDGMLLYMTRCTICRFIYSSIRRRITALMSLATTSWKNFMQMKFCSQFNRSSKKNNYLI